MVEVSWLGDRALAIYLPQQMSRDMSSKAHRLAEFLRQSARDEAAAAPQLREKICDIVSGFASVTVIFDRPISDPDFWQSAIDLQITDWSKIEKPATHKDEWGESATHEIPICFDDEFAPDLPDLVEHSGLDRQAIIDQLSHVTFYAYMVGFLPGFAYLGDMPPHLQIPRRASPRTQLPAGSLAVAGAMAGIYPLPSPGGWNIIGRTPLHLFDANRPRPGLIAAGDRILFTPQPRRDYDMMCAQLNQGIT
ncbi:MAG: 5-oxoprolinase subunit PxpB [Alphaproteobacteria bacterium]|nr:5-oxoprolinase subunit PxpB [Alphaproteobacteria bacterium]